MFFDKDDDDHDFLSPAGGSKLASLFGMDMTNTKGGNESLTYTAPKQPRKESLTPGSTGAAPDLTMACVVQTYKYVDNEYKHQGKLGAAILSNHSTNDYRILLYVSKQKQVTNVQISKNFVFTMQANNYATFYDAGRQGWSIMFESQQIAHKFGKEIAIAKANSCGNSFDSVVVQDLMPGEGGSLETGDSAEVKYSGWLLTKQKLGQMFDCNVNSDKQFRFKLGKGKVIKGWETGILGMKKSGRRVLVVPPNLAYGEQGMGDKVPANSILVFEIEMSRVKLARGGESATPEQPNIEDNVSSTPQVPSEATSSSRDTDGAPTEEMVKSRSRSINEQLVQSPKSDKARLISRMAKMGQPMLPMVGAIPATAPDSDNEEIPMSSSPDGDIVLPSAKPELPQKNSINPQTKGATTSPLPTQSVAHPHGVPRSHQVAIYQNSVQPAQPGVISSTMHPQIPVVHPMAPFQNTQPQPLYNQPYPPQTYPAVSSADIHVPVILSESRQHSAEMRLAMSNVSEKVDKILNKLEHSNVTGYLSSAPSMETSILMQNIQRIVQENEHLKKELVESGTKVENQNLKIAELLQQNQKYVEQSHSLLEQRNDSYRSSAELSQSKVLGLEQEKAKLATELSSATATVSSLQIEITQIRKNETELRNKLENSTYDSKSIQDQLGKLCEQHEEDQSQLQEVTNSYKEEKQQRKNLTHKINQLSEEIADLKIMNERLEKNVSDRKKKALDEQKKFEEEIDEIRTQCEADKQALRKKLYSQKTTINNSDQIEEELRKEYEEKNERALTSLQEKHDRALQVVEEEKTVLEQMITDLQTKLQTFKSSAPEVSDKESELQEQIEEVKIWREKYENFRSQASTMKSKYHERIVELEEEMEEMKSKMESMQRNPTLGTAPGNSAHLTTEVKKIMNAVYQTSRLEFSKDQSYSGSDVLSTLLQIIKSKTLMLVQQSEAVSNDDDSNKEKNEEENKKDEDQTQTPEANPSEEADNIPAKNISPLHNDTEDPPTEVTSDKASADLEIADGQGPEDTDGKRDDKNDEPLAKNIKPGTDSSHVEELPVDADFKTAVTQSEVAAHQLDTASKVLSDATAVRESSTPELPVSSNCPSITTSCDEPETKEFLTSAAPSEKNESDLSREDSFEDLRTHIPPPLFGSDDDDDDDEKDLFG